MAQVVREPVSTIGASRTDAGVHAMGQVVAFTTAAEFEPARLVAAVTSQLPDDVQVRDARIVDDAFSPISEAIAKGYRYRIAHDWSHTPRPLFDRRVVAWTAYALDPDRMHEGARHLVGTHDFTSFTRLNHGRLSPVRTIHDCSAAAEDDHRCTIEVVGDGFLHNMVRVIAGTLVEVGRGAIEPDEVPGILTALDRARAGPTMPPEGLCLEWVRFPGEEDPR